MENWADMASSALNTSDMSGLAESVEEEAPRVEQKEVQEITSMLKTAAVSISEDQKLSPVKCKEHKENIDDDQYEGQL